MAHGGYRKGAGRPKKSSLSPLRQKQIQDGINVNQILRRLFKLVMGQVEMTPAAVTAAGIMLKKVLPDLAAVDLSGSVENIHYAIADEPTTADEWVERYTEH